MNPGVHAILAGPAKDPNRIRTVVHGSLHVEGNSLRLWLNNETHARVTLDGPADMVALAAMLLRAAEVNTNGDLFSSVESLAAAMRELGGPEQ